MTALNKLKSKIQNMKGQETAATICYFLSNICSKAFGFITIPLYTNLLTTSEYGFLNTYNAWVSVLSIILGLSLSSAILGKANEEKEKRYKIQSSILSLSFISALLMSFAILGGYALVNGRIDIIVIIALIQGYATFAVNFILQEWVLDNKYILHSIVSILTVAVPVGITCWIIRILFQSQKYLCVIVPRAVIFTLIMIAVIIYVIFRGHKCVDWEIWKWSLKYSIPIVFHSLSLTVLLQADRIMISSLYGYDESGIYSFIYNVTLVIGVLIGSLENTWKTWFFNNFEKTNHEFIRKKSSLYIGVCIFGVFLYMLVSPELVKILANEAYTKHLGLIVPVAFAYIISFLYDFLVYVEYKKQATKQIASASIIAALSNIALNYLIIPKFGGMGAAFTTVISYAIQFLIHLRLVSKLEKDLYKIDFFIPFITISLIGSALVALFIDILYIRFIVAGILFVLFTFYIKSNKELLE